MVKEWNHRGILGFIIKITSKYWIIIAKEIQSKTQIFLKTKIAVRLLKIWNNNQYFCLNKLNKIIISNRKFKVIIYWIQIENLTYKKSKI